tara:strand:- start:37472 stop:38275 length:804 start_codon:yes stop_codon:yes gene_type:complete
MTLVSVCIPTYNSSEFISECLDSVISQSLENFEIIIADNCSSDNTVEIIKKMNISNIKIIQNKKNVGMAKNFNIVCNEASGKYIKLLPSDDRIAINSLQKSLESFETHNNISLVVSSKKIINKSSKKIIGKMSSFNEGIHNGNDVIRKILNSGRNPLGEPTVAMFKKEDFKKVGGFNEKYKLTLDIDLWIRLLQEGNLYFIEEPLGDFRVHFKSESLERNIHKNYLEWVNDIQKQYNLSNKRKFFIVIKVRFFNLLKQIFYKLIRVT